jgi:polyisoprenoid-binding protein YceI
MRTTHSRPSRRVILGAAAVAAIAVVAAVIAAGVYTFGGGSPSTAHAKLITATIVPTAGETVFTLDSSASEATFTTHEVLFGQPNTVVGKTNAVTGEILVNTQDPSKSRLGQIQVDLTTLVTDNDLRNNTIQHRILETSQPGNQYATFTATSTTGIPSTVAVGQTIQFNVTGNLTIHGVTRTATFAVTLTPKSATQLTGTAQTTVRYADFGIAIPNVPSVSSVSDTVQLALDFTANAKG